MTIEINGRTPAQTGSAGERVQLRAVRDEPSGGSPAPPATTGADTLALTGRAAFLQRLDAAIAAAPATDDRHIATVRQKIDDGSYVIEPARVAEKLIRTELALTRHGHD